MRVRGTLSALMAGALSLVIVVPVLGADILVYGPSDGLESGVATTDGGHTVTVADEATWAGMTTEQFAAFDAIVIGDAGCTSAGTLLDVAIANRTTWSPAVTGPITLNTFDPGAHDGDPADQTIELTLNSINYAASGPGTGLYVTLGCYYNEEAVTAITILDQFGVFTVDGVSGDFITIVNGAHPVMAGLTAEGLSDWGSSTHEHFITFPASFEVLANEGGELAPTGKGGGALVPTPVILGQGVPSPTPTPTPTATATATASPAASQLPNTTLGAPESATAVGVAALVVLLAASGLFGTVELRRRGVIGRR